MGRTGAARAAAARLATVVVVVACALAGCSGGEDEAAPDPAPSATSGSPGEGASPSEPPPPEPVDPCSLLTEDDLTAAGLRPEVERSVRGVVPDPFTTTCLVPHAKEGWTAYYGFSTRPGVKVKDAMARVSIEKPVTIEAGDRAQLVLYDAYGDRFWHAWASEGDHTVMVQLFAKPKQAHVEALLAAMLEQTDPAMFDFPVDLPDGCPPARTKPIVALLGRVATATGSELADDLRCDYANARGMTLNLDASPFDDAKTVRRYVGQVDDLFDEREQVGHGVSLFISPGEAFAYSSTYLERPASTLGTTLQRQAVIGDHHQPLRYDAERYRALARWWSRQRPEQLG